MTKKGRHPEPSQLPNYLLKTENKQEEAEKSVMSAA